MGKIRYIFFMALLCLAFFSCQKDQSIKDVQTLPTTNPAILAMTLSPGNLLATSGTLNITIGDSTYTFDAQKDSIAFVNLFLDNKQYFGFTAINKNHTMSFGISSAGFAENNSNNKVAGTQFLLSNNNKANLQYTLTPSLNLQDSSSITLTAFAQDSTIAKGTFITILNNTRHSLPYYKATGSFDLKIK